MKFRGSTVVLCVASLGIPSTTFAQQDRDRNYQDRDDVRRHFIDHELQEWYRDHADRFEPERGQYRWNNEDLEHRLQPGAVMDDELRRWSRPVSDDLNNRLDRYRRDGSTAESATTFASWTAMGRSGTFIILIGLMIGTEMSSAIGIAIIRMR
jgi:hypothetical protein